MKDDFIKPIYSKDMVLTQKFNTLRQEVNEAILQLRNKREPVLRLKSILFPVMYLSLYIALLIYGSNRYIFFILYALIGLMLVINFTNLIHDAAHQNISKNKKINQFYLLLFDLMGANSYIWQIRHHRLHHPFPNVMGWDSDFEQSPLARVYPQSSFKKFQRYQHYYLPFIYPLYLFNWLLVRDFKDFFSEKAIVRKIIRFEIPTIEYAKLFFFKTLFLFNMLVLPHLILRNSWKESLLGFVVMMFTASITSLIVLLSPHANIHSEFPEIDKNGKIKTPWFIHQIVCTNDVTWNNWFTRFFLGSFNFHVSHHLFPNISSVYLPEVTSLVEQFAKENDIPYRKYSLIESLKGHWLLLRNNSFSENLFEETM